MRPSSIPTPLAILAESGGSYILQLASMQMLLTAVNLPVTASYPGLDPKACGLTVPAARIEIAYHTRMDSSGDVYRVSTAQLPPLDESGTDALLDRFVALIAAGDVTSVAILAGQEAWLMNITPDAGGQTAYAINGNAMPGNVFAPAYTAIVGMQFDKTVESAPAGDAICEVRFLHADGTITRVAYHHYDSHYVQAETSGGGCFLLRRERLEATLNALKEATP